MATFPALKPSGRTFTPGDYPNTPFKAWAGNEGRVRHSNVMLESTLRLTFTGINETQMLSILTHYQGQRGGFESFALPNDVWSGVTTVSDYSLTGYRWCYTEPPTVTDLPCGNHIVELSLATVPPEGVSLNGLTSLVALLVSGGNVTVSDGLTKTITWSFAPGLGDAPVNADGITATITASIAGADVEIIPAGITATVTASIQGGAPVVSDGLSLSIQSSIAGGAAVVGIDPYFSNVVLLMHFDGTNGSTTLTDSSSKGQVATAYNGAAISTANSKFGGASLLLGSDDNDRVDITANADLALGAGDFTFEYWYRMISRTNFNNEAVFTHIGSSIAAGTFRIYMAGNYNTIGEHYLCAANSTTLSVVGTRQEVIDFGVWHHIAFCRSGTTIRCFRNGVLKSSATDTTDYNYAATGGIRIGAAGGTSPGVATFHNCNIDDLRITKGVARYTSNFTVPSAALPDS